MLDVAGGGVLITWSDTHFIGLAPSDWSEVLGGTENGGDRPRGPIVGELLERGYLEPSSAPSSRRVMLWLAGINVLIRTLGFGRTLRLASVLAPVYNRRDVGHERMVAHLKREIERAGRHSWLVSSDCKTQALTAFILTRRMGLDARLLVGLREHPLSAHTWTECCGMDIPKRNPRGYEFPVVLAVTM